MELNLPFMAKTFVLVLTGIPVTLEITFVALLLASPLAFLMALSRIHKVRVVSPLVTVWVSFIRGTPIVLQILIVYSLLPSLLNVMAKRGGWHVNVFDLNPIIYAFAVFILNSTGGLSEIFRSSLLTVDRGQREAALSAGLSRFDAYRRIIVPQALVAALPNLCNFTIGLIKGTSLAFIMTVKDVTAVAKIAASYGYNYIEAYLDIFVLYIIICGVTQVLFNRAEGRLSRYKGILH
jgi:L-cystine transport system permease protein